MQSQDQLNKEECSKCLVLHFLHNTIIQAKETKNIYILDVVVG